MERERALTDSLQWRGQVVGLDRSLELIKNFVNENTVSDDMHKLFRGLTAYIETERDKARVHYDRATERLEAEIERLEQQTD